ncbi:MAG TPA: hypothetical protein VNN98_09200 [Rhizomicrobium sp.]|nr:hypothetical protein [Rhizomicrobium sp.]
MKHLLLLLFSLAGGLTLSGIVANLYRLVAKKPQGRAATWVYYGVMLLAGPSVLVGNATRSFRKKECTSAAYGFALGLAAYWSFMLGLGLVELGLVF